uniref:Radical SAM superfamily enzyme YgiQ, UPF0313 family n=1 Tax=Candidatus Kentrum sp. FM TaxID=2126340 RepID=A0A450VQL4_9GAMM|nr:MAG: Radical SAM superfamily enzyme YgiQ, UPF0313 family [Candidatus Kentron sp. FM]VFJ46024.1 MAG: Radical SAM superfamily enzyme YgiQ, UPF0313 family [Candidatus Kentron sp. FM]VFK07062.1 MAG: Radical SAM superfamily enzyme YgiQ, UPF0313 family [Candidatus Kentron sp. FM]
MNKKTRILLIDITGDWLGSGAESGGRFAQVAQKAVRPLVSYPIGLMYLAASAKEVFGSEITCTIVSTALDCPSPTAVVRLAHTKQPNIVGIRALSMHRSMYQDIVRVLRDSLDDILILGGGPYPSCQPADALCDGQVDAVVRGEGEEAFVAIIEAYRHGERRWHTIPNVHAAGTPIRLDNNNPIRLPLDDIPFPEYSKSLVAKFAKVKNMSRRYSNHANIVSSRGCPYQCTYCHNIFGKRFRYRSEENVFDEIRNLYETHGIREFQFIDDIFNLRRDRLIGFFDLVVRHDLPLIFSFPNGVRGDILDHESVDAMIEGGTRYLFFAVESASERIQSLIHKNLKLDRIAENIAYASRRECVTGGFFMLGFPTETIEEVRATIEFACATDLTDGYFFVATYYPGTEMYDLAIKNGFEPSSEDGENFFKPKNGAYAFSAQELTGISRTARREFYFSEKRIELKRRQLPVFFSPKEITEITVSQITSCDIEEGDIGHDEYRRYMAPYFSFARRIDSMGIHFDF